MTEALPIGNGPMGAMHFGGTEIERLQFNEISLWSGDRMSRGRLLGDDPKEEEDNLGAHQAFGDIFIHLGHDFSKVTQYRQELDIDRVVHEVSYQYDGVQYRRTAFASHPSGVVVIHLTADKPAAYTGHVQLADMHHGTISGNGNKLSAVGKLKNLLEYESQLSVLNENGNLVVKHDEAPRENPAENPWQIAVPTTSLAFEDCDSVTLVLGAGTNFLQDHRQEWLGVHPHEKHAEELRRCRWLDSSDNEQRLRNLVLEMESARQRLVFTASLGALRFWPRQNIPSQDSLSGAQGNLSVLG